MTRLGLTLALFLAAPTQVLAEGPGKPDQASEAGKPEAAAKAAPASKPEAPATVAVRVRVPLADDRFARVPLASVDDAVVTVDDLKDVASATHADRAQGKGARMDFAALLDRLLAVRLLTAEARVMGIDDLPEVKASLQQNRQALRLELVRRRATAKVKADPAAVEQHYREAAREWKVRSVLFPKQEDATLFGATLAGGGDFDALAAKAAADGKGRADAGAQWLRTTGLQPEVVTRLASLKPGQATAPFAASGGFTVVHLQEQRQAVDPALRAEVEAQLRGQAAQKALVDYYAGLKRRLVTYDRPLLKGLDFDAAKPGIDALKADRRVVARVQGQKAITVGDVATEVIRPLFHGVESAQKEKRLDKDKEAALDALVSRQVVELEATRLKLDEQPEARRALEQFETNLLFSSFIDRVIIPELKIPEEELQAVYEKRKKDFTYPAFYRLEGLAFADAKHAQVALASLQRGTDFKWLKANAEGLATPASGAPVLDGSTVSANQMPEELRKGLAGVAAGDYRLYAQGGQHFVVSVLAVTPERVRAFEEVREDLRPLALNKALQQKLDEWVAKLRPAHDVKIYLIAGE